jgi:hypothetical protein
MSCTNQQKLSPVAETALFYENMLDESKQMEEAVDRYSSTLATTVLALKFNGLDAKSFKIKEMKEIKGKLTQMMANMKEQVQNEVYLLATLNRSINQISQEFRDILNVVSIS